MNDSLERLSSALAGRYTIESRAGQGGMATVYRAMDQKHHRLVAIKVLRPELSATVGPSASCAPRRRGCLLTIPEALGQGGPHGPGKSAAGEGWVGEGDGRAEELKIAD